MKDQLKKVSEKVQTAQGEFERIVERPRKSLERFPTIFLLLTTAGVVMVLFGFERLFSVIPFFNNNPILMIILGLGILIFTGQLFKKLNF